MARPWIRLYTSVIDSAKIQTLPDHLFKFLINLWCLCGSSNAAVLPPVETLAWRLRIDPKQCEAYLVHLREKGLLDLDDSGNLIPHDWDEHQFEADHSTERVRKFREKKVKQKHETVGNGFMKPFPSESVSVSVSESGKGECEGKTNLSPLDPQYAEFQELFAEVGNPIAEDFAPGTFCSREWNVLDPSQREQVNRSLRARRDAGIQVLHKPESYLRTKEWKRAVRPPSASALQKLIAEA